MSKRDRHAGEPGYCGFQESGSEKRITAPAANSATYEGNEVPTVGNAPYNPWEGL